MKTKRTLAVVVMLLGLLWGRDALGFYNPSTGRWLSRDPIGESPSSSLYACVGNDAVSRIDPLGLDDSGIVYNTFRDIQHDFAESAAAHTTGYKQALRKLSHYLPQIKVTIGNPSNDASAEYHPNTHTLVLRPNPDKWTVVHEMVHAWNDLDRMGTPKDRADEGMGYALEQGMGLAVWDISVLERILRTRDPVCEMTFLRKLWRGYWEKKAWPEQYPGGRLNDYSRTEFPLDMQDFSRLQSNFGFKLSCDKYAAVLNDILAQRGCCYQFICVNDEFDPYSVSPGRLISPVFRD